MSNKLLVASLFLSLNVLGNPAESIEIGQKIEMSSSHLKQQRPILIHLPKGYDQDPQKRYPVLFVLDGNNHFASATGLTSFLRDASEIPAHIVVAIPNLGNSRERDLMAVSKDDALLPFASFLVKELIPEIDKTYRTQPFRILAGHSIAGLFTLKLLEAYPQAFQAYLAASPYFAIDKGELAKRFQSWQNTTSRKLFLFASLGDEPRLKTGFEQWKTAFAKNTVRSMAWHAPYFKGESHMSTPIPTLHHGLRTLYADMRLSQDSDLFSQGATAIKQHFKALSKEKYGYEISWEKAINDFAMSAARKGDMPKAIALLQENAKDYPTSWSTQFRLARIYEASGDLKKALEVTQHAQTLAGDTSERVNAILNQQIQKLKQHLRSGSK